MKSTGVLKLNAFIAVLAIGLISGCGGENFDSVPVAGVVTMDGEPLPGVWVTFAPEPTESTSIVGPFSEGVTDANGKFTLKTRYGDEGAVVGRHRVSFEYEGIEPEALEAAKTTLAEAKSSGGDTASAQAEVDRLQGLMKGKIKIPARYKDDDSKVMCQVPAGGVDNLKFDLTSK